MGAPGATGTSLPPVSAVVRASLLGYPAARSA